MTLQADRIRDSRRGFAAPGGLHDRLVRLLGWSLPAAAGATLAVMVMIPFSPRGEISFLLDRTKVAVVADRMRTSAAMYRGQDDKGRAFTITAGSAVQHSAQVPVMAMKDLTARLQLPDGPATLTAGAADYDMGRQTIAVNGAVNLATSDGYRLAAQDLDIAIDAQRMTSRGPAQGRIPAGAFSADRIVADLPQRTVALEGHARLTMQPGSLRMP